MFVLYFAEKESDTEQDSETDDGTSEVHSSTAFCESSFCADNHP